MTTVTLNGNTYSDDGSAGRDMTNGGHRTWLLPMLSDTTVEVAAAAASELAAENYAAALSATSSTSLALTAGSKTLTTQADKQFAAGQHVVIARTAAPTTTYLYGQVTSYSGTALVVNVTVAVGSGGPYTDWSIYLSGVQGVQGPSYSATPASLSGATTLGVSDKGKILTASGTWTLAFVAAATLGSGWYARIHNTGTGIITLDPDGSETIDGLTSFLCHPGEARYVWCDGSVLFSRVERAFDPVVISSTTTFNAPPGYARLGYLLLGAGAGGARGDYSARQAGGGGWAVYGSFRTTAGEALTCTVGAGGAGATTAAAGADGGTTELTDGSDTIISAGGGTCSNTVNRHAPAVGADGRALIANYPQGHPDSDTEHVTATASAAIGYSHVYTAQGGTGGASGADGKAGGTTLTFTNGGGGVGGTSGSPNGGTAARSGGGGGYGNASGAGGNGGDGGVACGGGGGGAGSTTPGNGGDGGDGEITLWGIL